MSLPARNFTPQETTMTETPREHWRLRTYEVWGGAPDDTDAEWTVNNVWDEGTREVPVDATDDELLAVVRDEYLPETAKRIVIDNGTSSEDAIYFELDNGYPLCELIRDRG